MPCFKARLAIIFILHAQQVLGDERFEQIEFLASNGPGVSAHTGDGAQTRAADKYAKSAKEALLTGTEHVVAGGDCRAQRLMPSWKITCAACQQLKPTLEAGQECARRETT
jgi:hypothetical protein